LAQELGRSATNITGDSRETSIIVSETAKGELKQSCFDVHCLLHTSYIFIDSIFSAYGCVFVILKILMIIIHKFIRTNVNTAVDILQLTKMKFMGKKMEKIAAENGNNNFRCVTWCLTNISLILLLLSL